MKLWKKALIGLGILLVIVVVFGIAFFLRFQQMAKRIESAVVEDVDLTQLADGIYTGEYGDFLVDVKLKVTIKDHQITAIEITEQRSGPGYEATETIDRIIEAQSPRVDAATGSSRCIMLAVQDALSGN